MFDWWSKEDDEGLVAFARHEISQHWMHGAPDYFGIVTETDEETGEPTELRQYDHATQAIYRTSAVTNGLLLKIYEQNERRDKKLDTLLGQLEELQDGVAKLADIPEQIGLIRNEAAKSSDALKADIWKMYSSMFDLVKENGAMIREGLDNVGIDIENQSKIGEEGDFRKMNTCEGCGRPVSAKAPTCKRCGHPQ